MYRDRVWETSTSTGTGNFTLAGASEAGYRTFASTFATAAAYYVIVNRDVPAEWEIGSFTVSGTTLTRTNGNVLAGSSGVGTRVNFSAGTKDVYNAPPASVMQNWDTINISSVGQSAANPGGASVTGSHKALRMSGGTITLHAWTPNCNCNCNCDCYC